MASPTAKILAAAGSGLALALLLSVAVVNCRSARHARAVIQLLTLPNPAVESALRQAEYAAPGPGGVAREAKEPDKTTGMPPTKFKIFSRPRYQRVVAREPQLRPLSEKAWLANFRKIYGPLYLALDLQPDDIKRLESLASEHDEALLDIYAEAEGQGLSDDDPALAALLEQEQARASSAYRDLLGDSNYRLFASYGPPLEDTVLDVARDAALTGVPLSGSQAGQLMGILINASSRFQAGGTATLDTVDWPAALAQARGMLTPEQFDALNGEYATAQVNQYKAQFDEQELGN